MASILVATGFVRIDADTNPAQKAIKAFGAIGAQALTTSMLPVTAAVTASVGAMTASLAAAGAAVGAFGAAAAPQFVKVKEASEDYTKAQDAQKKVDLLTARAKDIAARHGIKYGQVLKVTKGMTATARSEAEEYNKALQTVKSTTTAAQIAKEKYQQSLADMPAATRQTTEAFIELKEGFKTWSDSLAGTTMPIFTRMLNGMREALPKLTPFVRSAATEIRAFVSTLGEGQAGRVFREFGANLKRNAGSSLRGFLDSVRNIVVGLVGTINAFMPASERMSGSLTDLTQRFADFGAGLKDSAGFQTFMSRARESGPVVAQTMREIGQALREVASAAGPLAGVGLTVLRTLAALVSATPTPVLQLLIPTILAVNLALKAWAIYQAAATAATWLFTTSVTASSGAVYANRVVMVAHRVQLVATAVAQRAAAAATWLHTTALRVGRAAMLAFRYALVAVRLAVVLTTTAFRVLAVAMLNNPIGLVVAAIALLVGAFVWAYKKSETFRNIVQGAMEAIRTAALWLWERGIKPAFQAIGAVFRWLYANVIKKVFPAIRAAFALWWAAVKFYFNAVRTYIIGPLAGVFRWLYVNVIKKIFPAIKVALAIWWGAAKAIFNAVRNFLTGPLAGVFRWLYKNVISPVWRSIRNTIRVAWEGGIRPAFNALRTAIGRVRTAFDIARKAIAIAWDKIREAAKKPINWVIRHVWNRGIVSTWKRIGGWIPGLPKLSPLKELAAGGTVGAGFGQRATPGIFNRPTAIVGEGNPAHPEFVIPTDPKYRGRARQLWNAAGVQLMADGGVIGAMSGVAGFLTNPLGAARKLLDPILGRLGSLGSLPWVKMITGLPRMVVKTLTGKIEDAVKGLFGGGGGGGDIPGGSGVKRWTQTVLQALRLVGQPAAYTGITLRRMNQESGGNPRAVNKWDINWQRGYPSVGLMQVIRPTFQSHAGRFRNTGPFLYGTSINPLANIYASMRYALAAYGSLPRAYNRAGGYALGTDGATSGWHWTGEMGPELMKLPAGTRIRSHRASIRQAAHAPGGVTVQRLVIENHGVIASRQEAEDWLVSSLDQLRRKGRMP